MMVTWPIRRGVLRSFRAGASFVTPARPSPTSAPATTKLAAFMREVLVSVGLPGGFISNPPDTLVEPDVGRSARETGKPVLCTRGSPGPPKAS
jgi:hypothetical protein